MLQTVDLEYYACKGTTSSQYHITESFTPNARQFLVCGIPGSAPSTMCISSDQVVLSIPHKTRFLNQEEDKAIWAALENSVQIVSKGRLIK